MSQSPGHTSVHTAFVGHFAARLHNWLLFILLSTKPMRASSTELLPSHSVFTLSDHQSNILLFSHLLHAGRPLALPPHTTASAWLQIFVGLRPLKVNFFFQTPTALPAISWSNYSWFHFGLCPNINAALKIVTHCSHLISITVWKRCSLYF